MKKSLVFCGVSLVFVTLSCVYNTKEELAPNSPTCMNSNVTYTQVASILDASCNNCHGGSTPDAGIALDNYAGVKQVADNGLLLCVIRHANGCSPMPQGQAKLNSCLISQIENWVDNGAPNN